MIYPSEFPATNDNPPEKIVFNRLKQLDPNRYDVFHSRSFSRISKGERLEYEVDFIIVEKSQNRVNAVLIVEVKGGRITYDGTKNEWKSNGRTIDNPVLQVTGNMHSLVDRYTDLSYKTPFGWAVCFPDTIMEDQTPAMLTPRQLMDRSFLAFLDRELPNLFNEIRNNHQNKSGADFKIYDVFKESLLRGLGQVVPLHKQIALAEKKFIQLTESQMGILRVLKDNKNILITGPAGSGKTVMATTLARETFEEGQRVLLLTYNRILANNIRRNLNLPKEEERLEVSTYHSIAKRTIDEFDENWWKENSKNDNFWEFDTAVKLDEVLTNTEPIYDVIIIDEGQDFRELWFESLERLLKPEGSYYVFLDKHQNIFNAYEKIPGKRHFFNYPLKENCRNTSLIINQLESYISEKIARMPETPEGEPVKVIPFKNDTEQLNKIKDEWLRLVEVENISPDRIVLMFNAQKRESCIGATRKFGKYPIEAVDRYGKLNPRSVNYTTINTFKGLEADVVFIIDTDKVSNPDYKVLYTQASRAKYLLVVFTLKN